MRKLFLYSGGAFIAGFAGIMSFLVVNNSNINEYVAQTPIQQTLPSLVNEPGSKSSNEEKSADGNNEQASIAPSTWSAPFTPTSPQSTSTNQGQTTTQPEAVPPTAPVQTTPETQPTEPVTDPVIPVEEPVTPEVPVDPEPEDDTTGLLEVILNPLF